MTAPFLLPLADAASEYWLGSLLFAVCLFSFIGATLSIRVLRRVRIERDNLLKEKEIMFNYMQSIGDAFTESDTPDLDRLLQRVLYHSLRTTHTAGGAIFLLGDDKLLHARAFSGVFPPLSLHHDRVGGLDPGVLKNEQLEELTRSTPISLGEGLVGQTADFGTPLLIEHAELDPRVPHFDNSLLNVRSILMVPMRFRHEVMGVLCVLNRVDGIPLSERDQSLLQALADQASVTVYYTQFRAALDEKRRLDQDIGLAMRIQKRLLPLELPQIHGLEMHAINVAAQMVGGDYYDVIPVDHDHVGIAIADVSGKGVGGALMMSICRSVLRAHATGETDPAAVLRQVNLTMVSDMYEDMFVTLLYMVYNHRTREIAFARAGHDPALVLLPGEHTLHRDFGPGMAIGMADADTFDTLIETTRMTLPPGTLVLAYTDGITEAQNEKGEEWGLAPLNRLLLSSRSLSPRQLCDNIRERVLRFTGEQDQYDDMTLLALKVL